MATAIEAASPQTAIRVPTAGAITGPQAAARAKRYYVATFAFAALALHLALGGSLGRTGVLHEWDVLFSADPTVYVTSLTTGQNTYLWGGRSFVHPNITNVLYPIVAPTAALLHRIHTTLPLDIAGRRVAYLVCPLSSAITTAILVATLLELGIGWIATALLGSLYLISFSALVFGSLPESYCLSGLGFALLFLVAARTVHGRQRESRWPTWVGVGAIIAGTTITNVVPFALVAFVVHRLRSSTRAALAWSAAVTAGALAVTIGIYALGAFTSPHVPPFSPWVAGQVQERHPFDPRIASWEFPAAVANTIVPPVPLKGPADPLLHQEMKFTVTFHSLSAIPGEWWRTALVVGLIVLALVRARRLDLGQQAVLTGAALVLAFNWALHAFYGSEMFLYSQHWEIALIVVLAALLAPRPGDRRSRTIGVTLAAAALVAAVAVNNAYVWRAVLRLLTPGG